MSLLFKFDVTLQGRNGQVLQIEHGHTAPEGTVGLTVRTGDTIAACALPTEQVERLRDLLNAHLAAEQAAAARKCPVHPNGFDGKHLSGCRCI